MLSKNIFKKLFWLDDGTKGPKVVGGPTTIIFNSARLAGHHFRHLLHTQVLFYYNH